MATSLMSLIKQAGFKGSAARTMYGIVMAESGGNAHALNDNASTGDLSYGLAQINMIGRMGPERLKQYGLSSNEDLYDPLTNLKVAYKLSGGGKHFGDWSTYNNGAYQEFVGGSGAAVKNDTGGDGSASAVPSKQDYLDEFKDLGAAIFKAVPELQKLMQQATAQDWSVQHFQDQVQASDWYRQHGATARSVLAQQASDPATYQQNLNNSINQVRLVSNQVGAQLTASEIRQIALNGMLTGQGSDSTWLQQQVASKADVSGLSSTDGLRGGMASTAQQLQQLAGQYGLSWTPEQIAAKAQRVLEGGTTIDTFKQQAVALAKSRFPGVSSQLDQGLTLADIAQPYQQTVSNLLEVDPSTVGLDNRLVKQALQGVQGVTDGKGSTTPSAMPLWQFEQQVRQDPRWQYTQNAHQDTSSLLMQIGKSWGFEP